MDRIPEKEKGLTYYYNFETDEIMSSMELEKYYVSFDLHSQNPSPNFSTFLKHAMFENNGALKTIEQLINEKEKSILSTVCNAEHLNESDIQDIEFLANEIRQLKKLL